MHVMALDMTNHEFELLVQHELRLNLTDLHLFEAFGNLNPLDRQDSVVNPCWQENRSNAISKAVLSNRPLLSDTYW